MSRPRLLLADDHKIVVEGLRSLLDPEFELVGTVGDGRALVEAAQASEEDLLPIGLCNGARVLFPVDEDKLLKYNDVEMPQGGFAQHLLQVQDQSAGA